MRLSKSSLAIELSKLRGFSNPKAKQEQYATDSEVAASMLWNAYQLGDIDDKKVVDLGCGSGILMIGAALLGAIVIGIDNDPDALDDAKKNIASLPENVASSITFLQDDILTIKETADTVLMNPPFGTKSKHADKVFLETALRTAPVIYSLHKTTTRGFLKSFANDNNCHVTHEWTFRLPLKKTYSFHKKKVFSADVVCVRMKKQ